MEGGIFNSSGTKLYTIKGVVNKVVYYNNCLNEPEKQFVLYDSAKIVKDPKIVKPIVEQAPNESRRNWHTVTVPLRQENFDEANNQKYIIEQRERAIRKEREEKGAHWKPKLFHLIDDKNYRCNDYKPVAQ